MKVWFDRERRIFFIEGARSGFTGRELTADLSGGLIRVWLADGETMVAATQADRLEDANGGGFLTAADALAYVQGEMAAARNAFLEAGTGLEAVGSELRINIAGLPLAPEN